MIRLQIVFLTITVLILISSCSDEPSTNPMTPNPEPEPSGEEFLITALPETLSAPGYYKISTDLVGISEESGVTILASNVTLDLAGHTIEGVPGSKDGIRVSNNAASICIKNGRIKNWGENGINVFPGFDVSIYGCIITNCNLSGIYIASSRKFIVDGTSIDTTHSWGIAVTFSTEGVISNNNVRNAPHGIQWWKSQSLSITGNYVRDVSGGGIWGAGGFSISVTGNVVENCGDIGIDFEFTDHSTASGNIVRNCVNAGIASFLGSNHLQISGNSIYQDSTNGYGIKVFGDKISRFFNIEGNNIRVEGQGKWGITETVGMLRGSLVSNNVIISIAGGGIRFVDGEEINCIGNQIYCFGHTGIAYEGIGRSIIANNYIETTNDNSSPGITAQGGMVLYWRNSSYPAQNNTIVNNSIVNFSTSINDDCWGDVSSFNYIGYNRVENIYRRAGAGYKGVIIGNVHIADPTIPITPTEY